MNNLIDLKNNFINKSLAKYGNTYNYTYVNYINNITRVTLGCNTHDKLFNITPTSHLQGIILCPDCRIDKRKKQKILKHSKQILLTEQRCYVCDTIKSLNEFSNDKSRPNGKMSRCKQCNRVRVTAYAQSEQGRARYRTYSLMYAYGITPVQYDNMVIEQNNKCAICKKCPKNKQRRQFYVDHDHVTGKIRGLLCGQCNSALGLFGENLDTLESAKQYIREHS